MATYFIRAYGAGMEVCEGTSEIVSKGMGVGQRNSRGKEGEEDCGSWELHLEGSLWY